MPQKDLLLSTGTFIKNNAHMFCILTHFIAEEQLLGEHVTSEAHFYKIKM